MSTALFTQSAQTDLLEARLFIAEDNLTAADRVLDSIETEAKMLATQPLMGRARPELADGGSVGRHLPGTFSFIWRTQTASPYFASCTMRETSNPHFFE